MDSPDKRNQRVRERKRDLLEGIDSFDHWRWQLLRSVIFRPKEGSILVTTSRLEEKADVSIWRLSKRKNSLLFRSFVMVSPLADWIRPTHIRTEVYLIQSTNLNSSLTPKNLHRKTWNNVWPNRWAALASLHIKITILLYFFFEMIFCVAQVGTELMLILLS